MTEQTAPTPATDDTPSASSAVLWLALLGVFVVALVVVVGVNFGFLRHWTAVHTGTIPSNNPAWYNFWSGFGSDLGEATLITAVVAGVWTGIRKSNCHTKGCWRIGHFPLEHTPFHLCHHHHPDLAGKMPTEAEILEHHRRKREDYEARHPPQAASPVLGGPPNR